MLCGSPFRTPPHSGAGFECPKIANGDGIAVGVVQLAEEVVVVRVVDIDRPVAEVANQEVARELSEPVWRDGESPGRVQRPARGDTVQQVPREIELVDEPVPWACNVVVL